jgi:hypothetical protein
MVFTACKTQQTSTQVISQPKPDITKMQGGMWIPSQLEGMNETEMQYLGSKLAASDIYDTSNPSIKDAIVQFNGGCTAEIISDKGLILTNHHCGFGAIQSHSSVEHDYLSEGFWAKDLASELPNPDMVVTFIVRMDNVTDKMFSGTEGLNDRALEKKLQENRNKILDSVKIKSWQEAKIKSFSAGNEFYLIISEDYKDIRFVGAPPSSIGKFGADTDNWMWPRHSGDFSLFRIYANSNNEPAEYSESNVPYKPKHFLPISLDGVATGDFTMIFGFPGRTNEYLPAVAIDQIVNKLNPDKIAIREASLAIMDKYMRQDEHIKIQYASKFAGIANYWKKWIGESQGLIASGAVNNKRTLEAEFEKIIKERGLTEYEGLLEDFDKLYKVYGDAAQARDYWIEVIYRNIELMNLSFQLYQLEQVYKRKGADDFLTEKEAFIKKSNGFYKNYNAKVDQEVFAKLMYMYDAKYATTRLSEQGREKKWKDKANQIYANSKLTSYEGLQLILSGDDAEAVLKNLNADEAYKTGKEFSEKFFNEINPNYYAIKDKIDILQKKYIKGLLEVFPDKRYFPDANSTLRVTYGQVKGYQPKDGVTYLPVSYLDGVIEKYVPGDYEFDVSQKLQDLYATKNYGNYGEKGKMPVNFIGTNHTTGGNSGSPVLDANGNLIGLNFDRVWEGTMSDYNYDADICRNIMVDARYVLFIIDKYAGASHLIEEMKLVHPKK